WSLPRRAAPPHPGLPRSVAAGCVKVQPEEHRVKAAYITHPSFMRHEMGPHHPECPERLATISDRLLLRGVLDVMDTLEAPAATPEQIDRAHDMRHYYELQAAAPAEGYASLDPDTAMNPHTWTAALHAAGALVLATELVARG